MSVTAAPAVGGKAADSASAARSDCGLLVGFPSVVNAPPSSAPIATTATTTAATQAPTVRHGCRALHPASAESLINYPPLPHTAPWTTAATRSPMRTGPQAPVSGSVGSTR